jgi:hypothetical protein
LDELIGKGIVIIIRGGGQFNDVRTTNIYCIDMDKAELINTRDQWEPKKASKKSKEERALDARTRIFERHQKESERRASLEGIEILEPIKPTVKTNGDSDVSAAANPPAQSATQPAAKTEESTKSMVKSVTYAESVEIYIKVAVADGSTIDDLAPLLGYAATSKLGLPRNVALTSEQWLAVCEEQFPKLVWTMGAPVDAPVDQKPATAPAKPTQPTQPKKSTPPRSVVSDLLAETFYEDVLDSKKSRASQVPVWSMVFFNERLSQQDGLHLIRCAGEWGWKEHIQKLKSDPVEFMLTNKLAIYDDYLNSDFFDPEAEDTGEPSDGWHPGDDERDLDDESDLYARD